MTNEAVVSLLEQALSAIIDQAGTAENTRIIPNLEVIDAAPTDPALANYIIVRNEQNFYGPVLKLPGFTYVNGDFVNVLHMRGTEPVAMQQGTGSPSPNPGWRVSEVYDQTLTDLVIDVDTPGNVTINSTQAERDFTIGSLGLNGLAIDGATGNVTLGAALNVANRAGVRGYDALFITPAALPGSPVAGDISIDSGATNTLKWYDGSTWQSAGGGGGAPVDAQYLTQATNATLTVERVFTPGTGLAATDGGAGSTYTLNNRAYQLWESDAGSVVVDVDATGNVVFNDASVASRNWRMESNGNANMFNLLGDSDVVIIGGATQQQSGSVFEVHGSTGTTYAGIVNLGDTSVERDMTLQFRHSNGVGAAVVGYRDSGASNGATMMLATQTTGGTLTPAVYITSAQNVGIGIVPALPAGTGLHIRGGGAGLTALFVDAPTGNNPAIYQGINGTALWIQTVIAATSKWSLVESGVADNRIAVMPGGNVGIGNAPATTAGSTLQAFGAFGAARLGSTANAGTTPVTIIAGLSHGVYVNYWFRDSAGGVDFGSAPIYSGVSRVVSGTGGHTFVIDWSAGNIRFYRTAGTNTGSIVVWAVGS
jgi:hypothetical protein